MSAAPGLRTATTLCALTDGRDRLEERRLGSPQGVRAAGRSTAGLPPVQSLEFRLAKAENHLIELLPRAERERLLALGESVNLAQGQLLAEPRRRALHVYFPVDGFISLLMPIVGHPELEVGMVGREGMLGAHLVLGTAQLPLRALVQGEGAAWRIGVAAFRRELQRNAALQRVLLRYLSVRMAQLTSAVGCLRYHMIMPRLARRLLMNQDRAHASQFRITHELLAQMLGVRRVGVTKAAGALQRGGLIEYRRGEVHVLDRSGLEAAACACYRDDCAAYGEQL